MTPDSPGGPAPAIDTSVPHSARIWNYWLGGKDFYPADREAGDLYPPQIVELARASRHFLARAVRHLAAEAGIRQFLDVGTGLPTQDHTHEIAQRVAPDCRVVYVDNDPLVLAHARALLTSTPEGVTDYIDADLREPATILAKASRILDFDRPIGLTLLNVMGHLPVEEAYAITNDLVAALPPGSHLVLADGTDSDAELTEAQDRYNASGAVPYYMRGIEEIARFFDGLELLPPGLVMINHWRPDPSPFAIPVVHQAGGVAIK